MSFDRQSGPNWAASSQGGRSGPPVFNAPPVVLATIGALAAAFALLWLAPDRAGFAFERAAGVTPLRFLAGPEANGGVLAMVAPLFSHMILHADLMHILFNSVWLLALGAPVATRLGAGRPGAGWLPSSLFISFFALSGAAGALFYILFNLKSVVLLVGASGGVSGLFGALVRFAFKRQAFFTRDSNEMAPLTDRRVIAWSVVFIIMNIFLAFFGGGALSGGSQVAWEAHVGGYLFGLAAFPAFDRLARAR